MTLSPGDTGAPYTLPWPGDGDIADVPQDIKDLADYVEKALDRKLEKAAWTKGFAGTAGDSGDALYQKRITVLKPTDPMPSNPAAGDIVFVVP